MKIENKCCGIERTPTPFLDYSMNSNEDIESYICLKCGSMLTIKTLRLDEEELQELKGNYEEELKDLVV